MNKVKRIFSSHAVIIALLFIATIISSCKKKCKHNTYTYNLTQAEKNYIPYNGQDTLLFLSEAGDTATFFSRGRTTYYYNQYFDGCAFNTEEYKEQTDTLSLFYDKEGSKDDIHILVEVRKSMNNRAIIYIYVNGESFSVSLEWLNMASIEINGFMYTNLYQNGNQGVEELLYNEKYGIIRFKLVDGLEWSLLN